MNILLAEAPFSYSDSIVKGERFFPLGIGYIASFIRKKQNRNVEIFVEEIEKFEKIFKENRYDVLGISSMTNTYPMAAKMARIAKNINPDCFVILGGQHASSVKGDVLKAVPEIDFAAVGEGEFLMDSFLEQIETKKYNWGKIPGLLYRKDGNIFENAHIFAASSDIEKFPYPARDLVDISLFKSHPQMRFGRITASMITSRGCPWECTYCSSNVTMGRAFRFLSADYVVGEIEEIYNRYGINNFVFWDDVLTLKSDRLQDICEKILNKKLAIRWFCQSRSDMLTKEMLKVMYKAGCRMISFGIESGNQKTLERIKKRIDFGKISQTITYCREVGVRTQGSFILGLPFETLADMNETIKFAKKTKLDIALFFSFTPFPGIFEWQFVPQSLKPKNIEEWKNFVCNNFSGKSWNPFVSDKELKSIIMKAHMSFYFRPAQIYRIFKSQSSAGELFSNMHAAYSMINSLIKTKYFCKKTGR